MGWALVKSSLLRAWAASVGQPFESVTGWASSPSLFEQLDRAMATSTITTMKIAALRIVRSIFLRASAARSASSLAARCAFCRSRFSVPIGRAR